MRMITASLVLTSTTAIAGPRVELGLALGEHSFSESAELGSTEAMADPGAASAPMVGARIGLGFGARFALEAEALVIPTADDVLDEAATVYALRAHARIDLLTGTVRPFVVAGLGAHVLRTASIQMHDDTDRALHWGGGVRYGITPRLDLRIDLRHLIVPDRTENGATSDTEVTAGMTVRFGGAKPRKPLPPPLVLEVADEPAPLPPPPPPPKLAPQLQPEVLIVELAGIGFELDSARLDDDSTPLIVRAYQLLHDHPQLVVEIAGHTSAEGDPERNRLLSLKRAEVVKANLVKRGIADDRIQTVGHGADVPIDDNRTEAGRKRNRRIEFRIIKLSELP